MKILVYGAGVLGSLYAARLQEAGHDVTILARGQRLAGIRAHGVVLEDAAGQQTTTPVRAVEQLGPEDPYDLVVVLVRKSQLASVLPALAANRRTPDVLFMTNSAAGPAPLTRALGHERVLLGFPGAAGVREGHIVRYHVLPAHIQPTMIGELSGQPTPRLKRIAAALQQAGFPVSISGHIDAWLKSHVALVSPIANALYMAGGDSRRLARTRDGVVLMVRAIQEGFRALRALQIPITPYRLQTLLWTPEPMLVAAWQATLQTDWAERVLASHAKAARDEMQLLADEFQALIRDTAVPTPAIDCLYTYIDPAVTPVTEGRAKIPLDWRSLGIALGALGAAAFIWRLFARRRR